MLTLTGCAQAILKLYRPISRQTIDTSGHTVNTSSGFDLDKQSYRFMECFQGKQADDVPWHQTDWPAKLLIPVNVEIVSRQKGAVWVSQASAVYAPAP